MRSGLCLSLITLFGASEAWAQPRRQLNEPPPRSAPAVSATDDERARSIEAQVSTDPVLRDDQITIEVSGKRVRLSGSVDNADERTHAEDLVRQTDPTLTVENLLQADENRQQAPAATTTSGKVESGARRAGQKAEKAATEVGEMVNDGWITSKVKSQLISAEGVRASAINVDTNDHVVTLRGQVRSEAERRKALKIARQTRGVEQVIDELTLVRAKDR